MSIRFALGVSLAIGLGFVASCTSGSSSPVLNIDASITTNDASSANDSGSSASDDSGITSCGDAGPKIPSSGFLTSAQGIGGTWVIDDADAASGCDNAIGLHIGFDAAGPALETQSNACAAANGILVPYQVASIKSCQQAIPCPAPGEVGIGVVLEEGSKIASIFERLPTGGKGKFLGTANLQDDGKLKVSFTAGAGNRYIRKDTLVPSCP